MGVSPTRRNCMVRDSDYGFHCRGDYFDWAKPEINNCTFSFNQSGIYCDLYGWPLIIDCNISYNTGTGIYVDGNYGYNALDVNNCRIVNNNGYGIRTKGCYVTVADSIISNNSLGGIDIEQLTLTVTGCMISNNHGSGISHNFIRMNASNCIFSGNSSVGNGGGIGSDVWDL